MMSKYRVIWIDDEWDEQIPFIKRCKDEYGIEIVSFKTSKDGMIALESNLDSWDAVILDVEVYNETENEVASAKGFQNSIQKISNLENKKKIPYFISTGKDAVKMNELFLSQYNRIYIKGDDDEDLICDLKDAANSQIETQIRHRYEDLFSWFPNENELLKILKCVETNDCANYSCMNDIRKVLEWVRDFCVELGIITQSTTELNAFSKSLCDSQVRYLVPIYIQRSIHSCTVVSQEGSHALSIHDVMIKGDAPYLLRSTVFELLNIIYWCKSLSRDHENIEKRRAEIAEMEISVKVESDELIEEGVIEQDNNRNYFCGTCLLPYKSMNLDYIGKGIRIKKKEDNTDDRTKDIYPFFVRKENLEILD